MLRKVISGAQTGVDISALRAAYDCKLETGGWMPKGFRNESGKRPSWAGKYGLRECSTGSYPQRTRANIEDSSMTLIVTRELKLHGGSALTRDLCFEIGKPVFHATIDDLEDDESFAEVVAWIRKQPHEVLNVAGSRESVAPGIEKVAEDYLWELFTVLKKRK